MGGSHFRDSISPICCFNRSNDWRWDAANPAFRADLQAARFAIPDLASLRFALEKIAADCDTRT
jgi:hypothetical protein